MSRKTRIVAVANNKGGTAKSTTAVNLADMLARQLVRANGEADGRVLLIDLDPQGHVARSLGLRHLVYGPDNEDGACLSFLLEGKRGLRQTVISANRAAEGLPRRNLYVIPATARLRDTGAALSRQDAMATLAQMNGERSAEGHVFVRDILHDRVGPIVDQFVYIILDCPPNLDVLRAAVYHFADEVIVPVKTDDLSVDGLAQHTRDLVEAHERGGRAGLAYIVPTMVRPRQLLDQFAITEMRKVYRDMVVDPIPELVAVKEAPANNGQTLAEYAPDSPATVAYLRFAERVGRGKS